MMKILIVFTIAAVLFLGIYLLHVYLKVNDLRLEFFPPTKSKIDKCLADYRKKEIKWPEYNTVLHGARDSLQRWIDSGLSTTKSMRTSKWYIDSTIFFNQARTKCLFLVPEINDAHSNIDIVYILAGERLSHGWQFYYQSYPANTFFRSENKNKPFNAGFLVSIVHRDLFDDHLFNSDCKINSNYIESKNWFDTWMRDMHKKFLKGDYNY